MDCSRSKESIFGFDGDISRCKTRAASIGFDAISSYGIGGGGTVQVRII
jgi:hypothetical protein